MERIETRERTMTDFGQMKKYADYIKKDPFRRGLHYPAVEGVLGDFNEKHILDVGCGDGLFPRLLAERGASVVGYDKSLEKITEAREHKDAQRPGLEYIHATPYTFAREAVFDVATSVMVLPYAASLEELTGFFRSTYQHLVAGGRFVSVVLNPSFSAFETDFFIRRLIKLQDNKVRMEFLDRVSGNTEMAMEKHQYTNREYERAAVDGGMKPESWKKLFATRDAAEQMGESFWQPRHDHQPYALFVARKE
jgi:2-polyprenyl-3-methyl-5-hydroxy-6-metoxy-1,4-benzoquinol methylase